MPTLETLVNLVSTLYGGYYTGAKYDKGSAFQALALAAVAKGINPSNITSFFIAFMIYMMNIIAHTRDHVEPYFNARYSEMKFI